MAQESTKDKVIKLIEKMSVLELHELVKDLEDKFGVSAAPVAVPQAQVPQAGAEGEKEEKTEFDIILTSFGDKKIRVVKEVREITGLGLKEAKDLVDNVPKPIKEKIKKEEAEEIKKKLEAAGAACDIK
jgi:large subunit ribosomal protein L7/L12